MHIPIILCIVLLAYFITGFILSIFSLLTKKSALTCWKDIPPEELVHKVVEWARLNIELGKKRRITPKIMINPGIEGSVMGEYYVANKVIKIYYYRHRSLQSLVETILHEYVHHLQIRHTRDNLKYDRQNSKVGYFNNPYEVEARQLSRKFRDQCIRDLNLK